jgi:uncharacterized protein (DUF58 family)
MTTALAPDKIPDRALAAPPPRRRGRARWLPTRRLVAATTVPLALALGALVFPQVGAAVAAIDGVIFLVCLLDWVRTPRGAIEIARETPDVYAVGRSNPVALHLKNRSKRTLTVVVNDDLFEGAVSEGLPATVRLPPHGRATLRYQVRPNRRGAYELGDHFVRYTSRGGLVTRQERLAARDELKVYPDVIAVRAYDLWARQDRADRTTGTLKMRGGESEFERLRQYSRDDEFRHIDWKATARRRSLTVRQYQTETQQNVLVMLDCGRAMRAEAERLSFLDHALNATLMLAHVALARGDQVGLLAFDDTPRDFVPPGPGDATERKIISAVYDLEARLMEPDYTAAFTFVKTRVRRRSLVVVFTQVLDPAAAGRLATLLRGLMPRHLPLCVMLRDRDIDQLAVGDVHDPRDVYVRGAAAEAILWREQLLRDMRHAGVLVIDAYPDQMTPQVLKRYVEIKARQLL